MAPRVERHNGQIELDEYDIVQNYVLGAHMLREFVKFYQRSSKENTGPSLVLLMPVLPVVLNKEATMSISKRHFIEGSLIKTLTEDKTLYMGLQERMEKMANQTFQSLSMAFSLNLLAYDNMTTNITVINQSNPPLTNHSQNYRNMLNASRRLGSWFAKLTFEELITVFKINF